MARCQRQDIQSSCERSPPFGEDQRPNGQLNEHKHSYRSTSRRKDRRPSENNYETHLARRGSSTKSRKLCITKSASRNSSNGSKRSEECSCSTRGKFATSFQRRPRYPESWWLSLRTTTTG